MRLKRILGILSRIFCFFVFVNIIPLNLGHVHAFAQDKNTKNVLILNSYQTGLRWTDHEVEGIITALNQSELKCSIAVEYMDWKNYPTEDNLKNLYSSLYYKYSGMHLDAVITTDDAALQFSLKNRDKIFPGTPIVFCGVNETGVRVLTDGALNVTGVVEKVDAKGTIQAAININPKLKKIYVIYDNTESGISTGELAIQAIHELAPDMNAVSLNEGKFSQILKRVEQVSKDSAILITTYYKDDDGAVVGFEEFSDMVCQRSQVPVYHLYEFGMDHGALGGSMLFGNLQGERAGNIAVNILTGVDIKEIPIDRNKTTKYVFDERQLTRFGILRDNIPENSLILHKPFSFIEAYRELVVTVLIIFGLLIVFIIILLFYLRKISRMKQKLFDSNLELTRLYDELAASDEELQQQFDELTITQRNLLDSEERYTLLFERMLNGFFVFEPIFDQSNSLVDFRFVTVNPSFDYHTERQGDHILGKTWSEVFGSPYNDLGRLEKILMTGEAERFEFCHKEEDTYYLVNAFRIQRNQVGVVIDNITDYKRAIKEVGKLNEELELRVIERTNDLQNAITELEAFAYTVSHDLKSPLRAVEGYSRIILEDYEKELGDEVVSIISIIRGICSEMTDMINKLLQYSTTARISLYIESVDMKELFGTIFHELKSTYPERRIEIRIETGLPDVMADRILLKQAVYNILSNAMKFTKNRENACITVGATITENEYIFYVKDNGVGFEMNYSQKLFNIFQRLHTSEEFEGSGIGLVTIKKIIEKHGGRVWIEGKVNVGATLFFTLPVHWDNDMNARGGSDV